MCESLQNLKWAFTQLPQSFNIVAGGFGCPGTPDLQVPPPASQIVAPLFKSLSI